MGFFEGINWVHILGYILFMLLGAAVTYYKKRPKLIEKTEEAITWIERLRGKAAEYIAKAEVEYQGTKRGGEKFNWVVEQLYGRYT